MLRLAWACACAWVIYRTAAGRPENGGLHW